MVLEAVTNIFTKVLSYIDIRNIIFPLLFYTLLLALYAVFVWFFYRSVSKRDLFKMDIHKTGSKIGYILKYLIAFPVLIFIWFAALAIMLFLLSKTQSTETILLMSMAIIATIRITSYFKEELSIEIAKIMPLALLALFVVDPSFFSLDLTIQRIYQVQNLLNLLLNYLLFALILEFYLRVALAVKRASKKEDKNEFKPATTFPVSKRTKKQF